MTIQSVSLSVQAKDRHIINAYVFNQNLRILIIIIIIRGAHRCSPNCVHFFSSPRWLLVFFPSRGSFQPTRSSLCGERSVQSAVGPPTNDRPNERTRGFNLRTTKGLDSGTLLFTVFFLSKSEPARYPDPSDCPVEHAFRHIMTSPSNPTPEC